MSALLEIKDLQVQFAVYGGRLKVLDGTVNRWARRHHHEDAPRPLEHIQ